MRVLVDTHAFVWWTLASPNLSSRAREVLEDGANEILISPVIAWETATKSRLGKWPDGKFVAERIDSYIVAYHLQPLPITIEHARLGGSIVARHRDPFDRLLAAQAQVEHVPLVTSDPAFHEFNIDLLW